MSPTADSYGCGASIFADAMRSLLFEIFVNQPPDSKQ